MVSIHQFITANGEWYFIQTGSSNPDGFTFPEWTNGDTMQDMNWDGNYGEIYISRTNIYPVYSFVNNGAIGALSNTTGQIYQTDYRINDLPVYILETNSAHIYISYVNSSSADGNYNGLAWYVGYDYVDSYGGWGWFAYNSTDLLGDYTIDTYNADPTGTFSVGSLEK